MKELLEFVGRLDRCKMAYHIIRSRDDAIMVTVFVPGEHWEVEFLEDGSVEIERFKSNGEILDRKALDELFAKFSD